MTDDAAWRTDVESERKWREAHYTTTDSPLSPEALARFPGVTWFPLDPAYRLTGVRLHRHDTPKPAPLAATGEDALSMVELGAIRFKLHGEECALAVYAPSDEEDVDEPFLFIPFRDATSGTTTYGGGRYLDLDPRDDDVYELDFNRAYHPYCVFDDSWSCIVPPPTNKLPVPVEAGERL